MTNGHGPKRAILYARVSTDEQARSGYSLAQQIEALRAYAGQEGYEVIEEVTDPGQSGASLERPGMDRVRDLVAGGGVSIVLAEGTPAGASAVLAGGVAASEELAGAVGNAGALLEGVLGSAPAKGAAEVARMGVLRQRALPLCPLTTNYR
jgi:hypothetical protein